MRYYEVSCATQYQLTNPILFILRRLTGLDGLNLMHGDNSIENKFADGRDYDRIPLPDEDDEEFAPVPAPGSFVVQPSEGY